MSFGFFNALMLLGLAAVALPVIAHLLSKRRYDVVRWGAMRFLELGQRTRRRIRIQDLLLLLLRMGLVAVVALALARPWGRGGLLSGFDAGQRRDVVFVLDASGSMDWRGEGVTPHQQAVQWIHEALELLQPGDSVALIEARAAPRRVVFPPTSESRRVRETLAQLPGPAGNSRLPDAIADGLQILTTTRNVAREIIVLTDDQAFPWQLDDPLSWARIDELLQHAAIRPKIRVVSFAAPDSAPKINFSLSRLRPSREVTVPGFPVRLRGKLAQSAGESTLKNLRFELDGQPLPERDMLLRTLPNAEIEFEIEHVFPARGAFLASVVIEEDLLPSDNRSDAVVVVAAGIPVLLVDGDPRLDETRSETFFLQSALAASGAAAPWIQARVITPGELTKESLQGQEAVFLCNVERLTPRQWEALKDWTAEGGGLVIAPGDKLDIAHWNDQTVAAGRPFLPAGFASLQAEQAEAAVRIDPLSLDVDWLRRFRQEEGLDLWQARFSHWYRLVPRAAAGADQGVGGAGERGPPAVEVVGRLTTGDPLGALHGRGEGRVLQLAFPLDADWSTLPARNDFVPFVHEIVFMLVAGRHQRNVDVGAPLLLPLDESERAGDWRVSGPGVRDAAAERSQQGRRAFAQFRDTLIPGVYRFRKPGREAEERFVVFDDGAEANLTSLTEADWEQLTADGRMQRTQSMREVVRASADEATPMELWWLLLVCVLALLVGEAALTRSMVQGGHTALETGQEG